MMIAVSTAPDGELTSLPWRAKERHAPRGRCRANVRPVAVVGRA